VYQTGTRKLTSIQKYVNSVTERSFTCSIEEWFSFEIMKDPGDPCINHTTWECTYCNKKICVTCISKKKAKQLFESAYVCLDCRDEERFREKVEYIRSIETIYGRGPRAKSCWLYTQFIRDPTQLSSYQLENLLNSNILGISDLLK
jgi:hypothetical protein